MNDSNITPGTLSSKVRERMEFIEFNLFWNGHINRENLISRFSISKPQATIDFRTYQELAEGNLTYSISSRRYIASEGFKPVFINPSSEAYFSSLLTESTLHSLSYRPPHEALPRFRRAVKPDILKGILNALQESVDVRISYQSPGSPEKKDRWIRPLVLVNTMGRWHVRSYCRMRRGFRSFILGRIISILEVDPQPTAPPSDLNWKTSLVIQFSVSESVHDGARSIIEHDYGMTNGEVDIEVRRGYLQYFLLENNFLDNEFFEIGSDDHIKADNGQVKIINYDQVNEELTLARNFDSNPSDFLISGP